ncbi:MAG: alanine dehydrogenase [Myxococcales bacterium]|nr:alanine dehydrogenase [Myxococcales bacterium]
MIIGIPRETLPGEGRVAAVPSAVRALRGQRHAVLIEQDAGLRSGFGDDEYIRAGAEIVPTAEELYDRSELVWKVLGPSEHEHSLLRAGLHVLALLPLPVTVPDGVVLHDGLSWPGRHGDFPARVAMSEIAGRLAVEAASHCLQQPNGGRGLLLGGVAGVPPAEVVVLGAGVAGRCAAELAMAMGARVTVLDVALPALRAVRTTGLVATPAAIERAILQADVVIAAVRVPGARAPRLCQRAHLALMLPGAIVVDLSVAEGGAFESTPVTTLANPSVVVDGVVHIGVPNFAGAVPRTASVALSHAWLDLAAEIAGQATPAL